jgi:hypothetical protein
MYADAPGGAPVYGLAGATEAPSACRTLARALYLGTLTESVAGAPVLLLCTRRPDYGRRGASTPT